MELGLTLFYMVLFAVGTFGVMFGLGALQYWLSSKPDWAAFSECGLFTTEFQVTVGCASAVIAMVLNAAAHPPTLPGAIVLAGAALAVGLVALGYNDAAGKRKAGLQAKVTPPSPDEPQPTSTPAK